mmetsp:Transcript_19596/g.32756  ORF Transcript_19596/g.32756 Transcript_19596/m.32756 type:complete len:609 (-) Transcript_19596:112-1938(-)
MGNSNGGKPNVATIHTHFDQQCVLAGTTVTGKIYLQVTQAEVSCTSIGSRIVGQEYAEVHYTESHGTGKNKRTVHKTARSWNNFLTLNLKLADCSEGIIRRGQYEYPFSFVLPSGSPASFRCGGHDKCSVTYSLEVWLNRPGIMRWDIKSKQFVEVLSPIPRGVSQVPLYIEPDTVPIKQCFCFNKGHVVLAASSGSAALSAGDSTWVNYALQNSSSSRIKAIEIKVGERVRWHARGHAGSFSRNLYFERLTPEQARLELAPVAKAAANPTGGEDSSTIHATSAVAQSLREIARLLDSGTMKRDVTIPMSAFASYSGRLIDVTHWFSIKICTPFGIASPKIQRPLRIHSYVNPSMLNNGAIITASNGNYAYDPSTGHKGEDLSQQQPSAPPIDSTPAPALPEGWAPVVAQPVVYPALPLGKHTEVDGDDEDNAANIVYLDASAITLQGSSIGTQQVEGYDNLVRLISANDCYDRCTEIEKWLANNRQEDCVEALSPEQFHTLFTLVLKDGGDVFEQLKLAGILADAIANALQTSAGNMGFLTCAHVAEAVRASSDLVRREVAEKLLSAAASASGSGGAGAGVIDKHNAELVSAQMSMFQFMTVERYFK